MSEAKVGCPVSFEDIDANLSRVRDVGMEEFGQEIACRENIEYISGIVAAMRVSEEVI